MVTFGKMKGCTLALEEKHFNIGRGYYDYGYILESLVGEFQIFGV